MNQPDGRPAEIFVAPASPLEQHDQPIADGSEEAMRRLRHPFELQGSTDESADPGDR
jgi:hypothetical protein